MDNFFIGFVIGMFIIVMVALIKTPTPFKTKKQIIEHNCGYYDPKTKEFKWGELK